MPSRTIPPPDATPRPTATAFVDTEAVTRPTGREFLAALLVRYWSECAEVDQRYLLQLAESYAARNAK